MLRQYTGRRARRGMQFQWLEHASLKLHARTAGIAAALKPNLEQRADEMAMHARPPPKGPLHDDLSAQTIVV